MSERLLVFSTRAYEYLRDEIRAAAACEAGEVEREVFPDGEHYQRILTDVANADVAIVGGTISEADTLELYDLACAAVKYGAHSLTLVIPYFAYSTMERATKPGEVVTAKTRARLLSSIPIACGGNRVLLLDLHSEGLPYYFEGAITPVHLYAKAVILDVARQLGRDSFVLGCTDAGRAKWVESLANELHVPAAVVLKRRLDPQRRELVAMSAQVSGQRVLIYDDMIRTGGSLLNAAQAYRNAGAQEIFALTTHGVFPGDALERIRASGLFKKVVCTNSHPRAVQLRSEYLEVLSVARIFAERLRQKY